MNIEVRWAGLWLGTLAVTGATLSIILVPFLDFSTNSSGVESNVIALPVSHPQVTYFPPRPEDAPEPIRDAVLLGAPVHLRAKSLAETPELLREASGEGALSHRLRLTCAP